MALFNADSYQEMYRLANGNTKTHTHTHTYERARKKNVRAREIVVDQQQQSLFRRQVRTILPPLLLVARSRLHAARSDHSIVAHHRVTRGAR